MLQLFDAAFIGRTLKSVAFYDTVLLFYKGQVTPIDLICAMLTAQSLQKVIAIDECVPWPSNGILFSLKWLWLLLLIFFFFLPKIVVGDCGWKNALGNTTWQPINAPIALNSWKISTYCGGELIKSIKSIHLIEFRGFAVGELKLLILCRLSVISVSRLFHIKWFITLGVFNLEWF